MSFTVNINETKTIEFIASAEKNYRDFILTLNRGIRSSSHTLKGGAKEPYFIDIDHIIEDPKSCEEIAEKFSEKISQISEYNDKKIDYLGFIEKDGIGTNGAIRLSGYISSKAQIPNIIIRHTRDIPCAKIKISGRSAVKGKYKLKEKTVLLISDVSTTGTEIIEAISDIQKAGGTVSDVVLYFSRTSIETRKKFYESGVTVHSLITESQTREMLSIHGTEGADNISNVINHIDNSVMEDSII